MSDPEDRRRADLYELELRRKAELDPGNCWELIWFLGLPLEVRCSYMRILEVRIDQASTREYLFRQACYHRRSWREQEVPCMLVETVKQGPKSSWGSIGRRQIRKSTTSKAPNLGRVGNKPSRSPVSSQSRAAPTKRPTPRTPRKSSVRPTTHSHSRPAAHSKPQPSVQSRPSRTRVLVDRGTSPSSFPTPAMTPAAPSHVPHRPDTPDGLRAAVSSLPQLLAHASGYNPTTLHNQSRSPASPAAPPTKRIYAPGPRYCHEGPFEYRGKIVQPDLPFIVASGRTHMEPWKLRELPVTDAGCQMVLFDEQHPGVLNALASALFPAGLDHLTAAVPASRLILELVVGWLIVPLARESGQMPQPWQKCSCGEGVIVQW